MKKLLLLLAAACCIASCAEIRTTYIGKAYPTTGADAIVFEGVVSETSAPTYTTTEKIEKNDDGSKTRTATTSQSVFTTNRLLATFIKYKTQTN